MILDGVPFESHYDSWLQCLLELHDDA